MKSYRVQSFRGISGATSPTPKVHRDARTPGKLVDGEQLHCETNTIQLLAFTAVMSPKLYQSALKVCENMPLNKKPVVT